MVSSWGALCRLRMTQASQVVDAYVGLTGVGTLPPTNRYQNNGWLAYSILQLTSVWYLRS
jgi:hypothetical protein